MGQFGYTGKGLVIQHDSGRLWEGGALSKSQELVAMAIAARHRAYAPYSRFAVGAAVRTAAGKIYTGCNIENASYGATCCAERVAIFKAVSDGDTDLVELAVVAEGEKPCSPCGICRQVMVEFNPQMKVWLANLTGNVVETTAAELLPASFDASALGGAKGDE